MDTFWMVQESVTSDGFFIVWEGIYATRDGAERAIERANAKRARAVQYTTGRGNGPIPVEAR